jgi:hypothetical protein
MFVFLKKGCTFAPDFKNQLIMKNIKSIVPFLSLVVLSFSFVSCEKEKIAPVVNHNHPAKTVSVEYRITSLTGDITVNYLAPCQGLTGLNPVETQINKTTHTITFDCYTGTFLSIEAWNNDYSKNEIILEIFVDGEIFQTGTLNHNLNKAVASGTYY